MWAAIIGKLMQWTLSYVVMPLLSKIVVWFVKWWQERQEEEKRNAAIDAALKKYEEAKTPQEQEDAFKELIRRRRPNG